MKTGCMKFVAINEKKTTFMMLEKTLLKSSLKYSIFYILSIFYYEFVQIN